MKIELSSPSKLIVAGLVDPLDGPAAFINNNGEFLHQNAQWKDWFQTASARLGPRALAYAICPPERSAFHAMFAGKHLPKTTSFACNCQRHTIRLIAFQGAHSLESGCLVLILPKDQTPDVSDLELRMEYLIKSDQHGLWDLNFATGNRYYSEGWYQLRGYSENEPSATIVSDWMSRIHPDDRAIVSRRREAVFLGQSDELFDEYRERHADGYWIWVHCRSRVVARDAKGRALRVIGTDTNISHLKFREGQYDDLSMRLQLAINASGIGVFEYNVDDGSVTWDQNTRTIYGVEDPRITLPATFWSTFIHPVDRERVLSETDAAIAALTDFDLSFRIFRRDGELRHVRSKAGFLYNQDGAHRLIGVTWDVTTEARQSAELEETYALVKKHNTALAQAHAEMEYLSNHDMLTGLANRRKLDQFQDDVFQEYVDTGTRCAVFYVDLDRFKSINDTLGHGAGDAVLKRVAAILKAAELPNSLVARTGGDEFAIFVVNAPPDNVLRDWAKGLICEAAKPLRYDGNTCRFGLSVGVATHDHHTRNAASLFSNADLALYQAKKEGRGGIRFYTDRLRIAANARRQCGDDILESLEQQQFGCVYQPQYATDGHTITGIEALARWHHPTRGILSPDMFLDIGEDLDVITRIDEVILNLALRDATVWQRACKQVPQLSVNVSGRRLLDPRLPDRIAHLKDCPFALSFELLETIFLDHEQPHLATNLAAIRDLGISIEVDDFGTGHASVAALLNLQPDRLKIDKALVKPIVENARQRRLVKSIIDIGRVLNISVVAEGAETDAHIAILRDLGCDYLQGFGLCHPLPAQEIVKRLLPR